VPGLTVSGIGVRFGGLVALDDVSLEVPPGQVVGVIGPNGAGKTTLFNIVCGFVRPGTGSLAWRDAPLRPRPDRLAAQGIARTLQGVGLFAGLSVLENVMVGGSARARAGFASGLFGLPRSDADERRLRQKSLGLLAELGVADAASALPGALPYPVQKRVAVARALVGDPELVLLDEPAGGLGGGDMDDLGALIRSLPQREAGACSVMLVEHHMDLVMSVCDHVVVLDFGRVVAAGTPAQVQADPVVATAYLGADVPAEAAL